MFTCNSYVSPIGLFLWRILIHWAKGYGHLSLTKIAKLSKLTIYTSTSKTQKMPPLLIE